MSTIKNLVDLNKLLNKLLSFFLAFREWSIMEIRSPDFSLSYESFPETRDFNLYENVWWRGEKWYIVSWDCVHYSDGKVWKFELENYPCKYGKCNVQYVDSREVKKIVRYFK